MDSATEVMIILVFIFSLFAALIYVLFYMTSSKKKLKREIAEMFGARESGEDLIFRYRNYDVMVTFRPEVKVSILHNRDVEDVKAPPGATLTPMYLIFRVKKSRDMGDRMDRYIDFLDSIPTR